MISSDSSQGDAARRTSQKIIRRRELIMQGLAGRSTIAIEELIASLSFSPATVRRDLREMLRAGLIHREHGFVGPAESVGFEPFLRRDLGYRQQIGHMSDEKRRIGAAAADLIGNGEAVGIAPGTTTAQLVRGLKSKKSLTIVTNAVNIGMEMSRHKECTVNLTGGYLSGDWLAMVGPRALDFIQTIYLDKFFFGANGIHSEYGITDRHTEEATVNGALAGRAKQRIVLADHTKLGEVAMCRVCQIQDVNLIITDEAAGNEALAPFRAKGVEIRRV